jgi:hypothetical protein
MRGLRDLAHVDRRRQHRRLPLELRQRPERVDLRVALDQRLRTARNVLRCQSELNQISVAALAVFRLTRSSGESVFV